MDISSDPFEVVDHINMNTYDNRKSNLRVTSKSINSLNKDKRKGVYLSKYKGVCISRNGNWRAYINFNSKRYELGTYKEEIDAARAYNMFVIKYLGYTIKINETEDDYNFFTPIPYIGCVRKSKNKWLKF